MISIIIYVQRICEMTNPFTSPVNQYLRAEMEYVAQSNVSYSIIRQAENMLDWL